jgi:hypothetical protein
MFIERLKLHNDIDRVTQELEQVLQQQSWEPYNQIGLTRREQYNKERSSVWLDASGSLYDDEQSDYVADETDYNTWNIDDSWYTRQQVELLSNDRFKLGRVRFMLLKPKTGLTAHRDREFRYHLVLKTNPKSYISYNNKTVDINKSQLVSVANCYHIPADGYWYRVDTRQQHWVYNGGATDRIHLVVCGD